MSDSPSAVLHVEPFFLIVKGAIQTSNKRTLMTGIIGEPNDIPDPKAENARDIKFYISEDRTEWKKEGTLLFCQKADVYLQADKHGLLVSEASVIGTMAMEEPKKKWTIDKLPLEPDKIQDCKIAVWQIPPKA